MNTLYTKNISRTEIIQTTNPSSVWETGSVWRSFQIFSSGKPSAKQASRMHELICGLRVRQRPEKQNKKDVFTLTNTLCLVLPCDTRAKCRGIACSHTIHLSHLPATWGYLSCLWRMALGSPPKGGAPGQRKQPQSVLQSKQVQEGQTRSAQLFSPYQSIK